MTEKQYLMSNVLIAAIIGLIVAGCIFGVGTILRSMSFANQPETIELTIEHLWEEDNNYYFADSNGSVYILGNYRDINEKIMYDEMPKQRFERLNEGSRYEIEYISGLNNWISISEKKK